MSPLKRRCAVLIPYVSSLCSFVLIVQAQTLVNPPAANTFDYEKVGVGAIAAYFAWWTTTKLSSSIDKLTEQISALIEHQEKSNAEVIITLREQSQSFRVMTETFKQRQDGLHARYHDHQSQG